MTVEEFAKRLISTLPAHSCECGHCDCTDKVGEAVMSVLRCDTVHHIRDWARCIKPFGHVGDHDYGKY